MDKMILTKKNKNQEKLSNIKIYYVGTIINTDIGERIDKSVSGKTKNQK